jgi:hypothetical protein
VRTEQDGEGNGSSPAEWPHLEQFNQPDKINDQDFGKLPASYFGVFWDPSLWSILYSPFCIYVSDRSLIHHHSREIRAIGTGP